MFCHNCRFGSRIGEPSSARKKNVLCSVWTKIRVSKIHIVREYQCDQLFTTRVYHRGHLCYLQNKTTELLPWSKTSFDYLPVADPGEGPGGGAAPLIFRLNKNVFWDRPLISPSVWMTPHSPPYLKVWIRPCLQTFLVIIDILLEDNVTGISWLLLLPWVLITLACG